jgi:hypothetical protein
MLRDSGEGGKKVCYALAIMINDIHGGTWNQLLFSFDPLDFPTLTAGIPDSDEEFDEKGGIAILPKKRNPSKRGRYSSAAHRWNPWASRGCRNVLALFILLGGLISLL